MSSPLCCYQWPVSTASLPALLIKRIFPCPRAPGNAGMTMPVPCRYGSLEVLFQIAADFGLRYLSLRGIPPQVLDRY